MGLKGMHIAELRRSVPAKDTCFSFWRASCSTTAICRSLVVVLLELIGMWGLRTVELIGFSPVGCSVVALSAAITLCAITVLALYITMP